MIVTVGALVFGLVVGFITYRTLVRTADKAAITDLAAVVGVLGGGAVTGLYDPQGEAFAWYAVGLAVGMVVYFAAYWKINGRKALARVMSGDDVAPGNAAVRPPGTGPQA